MPPYLAGRDEEKREFARFLDQRPVLQNVILTGLRGLGKTVLLETFKPMAIQHGWLWAGTDLSESTTVSETTLATRLLTDLSLITSTILTLSADRRPVGMERPPSKMKRSLDYDALSEIYNRTPGLVADKLKAVLERVWEYLKDTDRKGVIFAYDEAQNLADHAAKDQYPLSLLLDVFQSIQRKGIPYMLVLTGLPTLLPKLVEARTYAERMFHVIALQQLGKEASRQAIVTPTESAKCPVKFSDESVDRVYSVTRGYPYFIQYVCREIYDIWSQEAAADRPFSTIPIADIMRKLDVDFFAGRWARATDRQRDLLRVIAMLDTAAAEFTVQEVVEQSAKVLEKPFSSSHVNQMLAALSEAGLVYKSRWGRYSLAVPLLDEFIRRQIADK
ncbi:MAG: AAA family ATPase [bacterium]